MPNHDSQLVRWALNPTTYPLENVSFEVFRSFGPAGPWELAGEVPEGIFHFYDYTGGDAHSFRENYYIVRVADKTGKGYRDSAPVQLEHDADNIALELVRKKNLYLANYAGIAGAVLIKKRWGAKCSRCWDTARQIPTDSNCKSCYGTGYSGGFMAPVYVPMLAMPSARNYAEQDGARYEQGNSVFEIANVPDVAPDDILIDRITNARMRVTNVDVRAHRMWVVSQTIYTMRLDAGSVIYDIPIDEPASSIVGKSWFMMGAK